MEAAIYAACAAGTLATALVLDQILWWMQQRHACRIFAEVKTLHESHTMGFQAEVPHVLDDRRICIWCWQRCKLADMTCPCPGPDARRRKCKGCV